MAEPGKLLFVTPKSERKLRQLVGAPNTTDYGSDGTADTPQQNIKRKDTNTETDGSDNETPIMFRCEFVTEDGDGNKGQFIHVFDETYDGTQQGKKRAGEVLYDQRIREWIDEVWLEIPTGLTSGVVYLNHISDFSTPHYNELKIADGDYRYSIPQFRQSVQLASFTMQEQNGEDEETLPPTYQVTQLIHWTTASSLYNFYARNYSIEIYYYDISDRYATINQSGYSDIAIKVRIPGGRTLKPIFRVNGYSPPNNPNPDFPVDTAFAVDSSTGAIPNKSIMYWMDDNYRLSGEVVDYYFPGTENLANYQINFRGRAFFNGRPLRSQGADEYYCHAPNRPLFDWSNYPCYQMFNVDFIVSRTRNIVGNTLLVTETATALHVFSPENPTSQYAGWVQYTTWQAPVATLPLTAGTLYLTCTWNTENSEPVFAYTFDISQIDQTKTWVKQLAVISGNGASGNSWRITQNADRDFNIYGRWV